MTKQPFTRKSKEEKQKILQDLSTTLNQQITDFVENPEHLKDYFSFKKQFRNYSVRNTFLIKAQNPHASFVASFTRWNELGYTVNKGEKAIRIFTPVTGKFYEDENKQLVQVKYAPIDVKQKIKKGLIKTQTKVVGMSYGSVFDISQTNVPLEDYPKLIQQQIKSEVTKDFTLFIDGVKDYAEGKNIPIHYESLSLAIGGYYSMQDKSITLNNQLENEKEFSVLVHELAHSQLHNENQIERNEKEVQAEASAYLVMGYYGLEDNPTSVKYIKDYSENLTEEQRMDFIQSVVGFADEITNHIDDYIITQERHKSLRQEYQLTDEKLYPSPFIQELYAAKPEGRSKLIERFKDNGSKKEKEKPRIKEQGMELSL